MPHSCVPSAKRLSLVGPLEAGRLVSSLSGFVEALVTKGEGDNLVHQKEDDMAFWGSGEGVGDRVCQVNQYALLYKDTSVDALKRTTHVL